MIKTNSNLKGKKRNSSNKIIKIMSLNIKIEKANKQDNHNINKNNRDKQIQKKGEMELQTQYSQQLQAILKNNKKILLIKLKN